jgi:hypothetical protein
VSKVINNKITNSLMTALLLGSSIAVADSKYPAADFQPSVVYQDNDYIAKNSQASSASSSSSTSASQASDPKYPAANFQPKVVYNDPSYKHSESASSGSGSDSVASSASGGAASSKSSDSSSSYLIGLVLASRVLSFLTKEAIASHRQKAALTAKIVPV